MTSAPRIRLCELREFVSNRSGKSYLSGFLGGARVVVMRDDRAECTGREVARWTVFLEEQPPREGRQDRARETVGRQAAPSAANGRESAIARPEPHQRQETAKARRARTAADRRGEELLRGRGIDPDAEPTNDELPF